MVKSSQNITDVLFVDYVFKTDNEKYDIAKDKLVQELSQRKKLSTPEEITGFTDEFFSDRAKEDVDFEYLFQIIPHVDELEEELIKAVNHYALTFRYEEMDTMDQALFLLGYIEFKVIQTPKEVIINELIELAKRYSDEGAPRLINGIMHKVLTDAESTTTI